MVKGRQQNGKSGIVVVVVVVLEEDCEEDEEACSFQAQFNFSIYREFHQHVTPLPLCALPCMALLCFAYLLDQA